MSRSGQPRALITPQEAASYEYSPVEQMFVRDRFADPAVAQVLAPETDRAVALSGAGMAEILGPDGTIRAS